jgi:hypothetical protein
MRFEMASLAIVVPEADGDCCAVSRRPNLFCDALAFIEACTPEALEQPVRRVS